MRRWLLMLAAVSVLTGSGLLGAPAATAAVVCAPGSVAVGSACIGLVDGRYTGGPKLPWEPLPLNKPGGVLAASNGVGGSTAANAARAGAAGLSKGASMAGRIGQAGALLTGFSAGYWFGDEVAAPLLCGLSDWFCKPEPGPDFVPNVDVVVVDAGWLGAMSGPVGYPGGGPVDDVASVSLLTSPAAGDSYPVDGLLLYTAPGHPGASYDWPSTAFGFKVLNEAGSLVMEGSSILARVGDGSSHQGLIYSFSWATPKVPYTVLWPDSLGVVTKPKNIAGGDLVSTGGAIPWDGVVPAGWTGYAFTGSSYRPDDVDPDPARTLKTSITCGSQSGPDVVVTAASAAFHETDPVWPSVPVPHCPEDTVPAEVSIDSEADGLSGKRLWETEVPAEVQTWAQDYPECVGGGCTLRLSRIGPAEGDLGDCFAVAGRCAGWIADPDRDTNFECSYGVAGSMTVLALEDCYVYGPTFDPGAQAKGIPYADPATGETPNELGEGSPEDAAVEDGGPCWPSGWGVFNPLEWVFMPIKCALAWAFVPDSEALASAVAPFRSGYEQSSVATWLNAATGSVSGLDGGDGGPCSAWVVDYPMATGGNEPLTVVDPCTGAMATVAGISRTVSTVVLVVLGGWACVRILLGAGFGVRIGVAEQDGERV